MSKSISYFRGFISCSQVHRPHYGRDKCRSFDTKQVFHHPVTFCRSQQVLKVSACRRDTQLRPAPCVLDVTLTVSNRTTCLLNEFILGTSFGLFAQNVWRNALFNFVKSCSRPYVSTNQVDSPLLNGGSARKCRKGLLVSGAIYNPQTYFRQKLRLLYKMAYFKLYVKSFKMFSRAFL